MPSTQVIRGITYSIEASCAGCTSDLDVANVYLDEECASLEVEIYPCNNCQPEEVWVVISNSQARGAFTHKRHAIEAVENPWPRPGGQRVWVMPNPLDDSCLQYISLADPNNVIATVQKVQYLR